MARGHAVGHRTAGAFQSAFAARLKPQFRWASAIDAGFKREIPRRLGSMAVAAYPPLASMLVRLTRLRPDEALAPSAFRA